MMRQNNNNDFGDRDFGKHDDFDFNWDKQHNFDWNKHDDFDFDWNKQHDNFDWCESPYYPYYPYYPYPDSGCWEYPYGCEYPYYPYRDSGCWEYPYGCEYPYPYESEDHFVDMGGF